MGRRPVEIYYGTPPRVLWTDGDIDGAVYRININSEGTYFQQFAYQLAHEMGHIKFGPARSNHLLEVFAEMVSLTVVKRLGRTWRDHAPYLDKNINWNKLADTRTYFNNAAEFAVRNLPPSIRDGFNESSVEGRIDRLASIRSQVESLSISDQISRAFQQTSAHLILDVKQHRWKDLLGIGLETTPSPADCPLYKESLPLVPAAIPTWVPRHLREEGQA